MTEQTLANGAPVRVTVAVSVAVLVQSALALVWAGSAAERLSQLEQRMDARNQLMERTARLEEQVLTMRTTLDRIEQKI
ncbi:MAG: hypothetical protein AAFY32_06595, partial [Pseudomonadota bacterium]